MPFISSVSGSKGGLIWPLGTPVLVPTITINTTTNYNQNIATFNATVNPNGGTTSVKFQYSTNSGSTWTDGATISNLTGNSQSVYSNQTGLSVATGYTVRAIATNSAGSTTSSTTTFTTWRLIEWANGTAGTYSITVPTVTPTGGTTVIPSIYDIFIYGGGGGSNYGNGGAGGGYRLVSSRGFTSTSNQTLSLIVGYGGTNAAGGTTQIYASNFTSIDAGGGGINDSAYVGYGDNPAYQSGVGASYSDGGKNSTIYLASSGGGGISGYGGNGSAGPGYGTGGYGGPGGTAYGYPGGAGGRGSGSTGDGAYASNYGYGSGGNGRENSAGTAGLIRFLYYGA
jgi:hypothetical protein